MVDKPSSFAPPSALPDISPSWGEIILALLLSSIFNAVRKEPAPKLPISPQEGEMPGRAEGGAKDL
ncbi:precorrin-3B synthase, partial [Mesorhizobium sp. B4-1-3]